MTYSTYLKLALGTFILSFLGAAYAVSYGAMPASMLVVFATGVFAAVCGIAADNKWKNMREND
jgi:hypothetical protein